MATDWDRYGGVPGVPSGLAGIVGPGASFEPSAAAAAAEAANGIAFNLSVKEAQRGFFDRAAVRKFFGAIMANALSRFGAYVMTRARQSIREVGKKGKPAAPGSPPKSRTGLLKHFIYFSMDLSTASVVIGPAKLDGLVGDAPRALEYGGPSERRLSPKRAEELGIPGMAGIIPITVQPHPYMGPAYESVLPQWPQILAAAVAAGPNADWTSGPQWESEAAAA